MCCWVGRFTPNVPDSELGIAVQCCAGTTLPLPSKPPGPGPRVQNQSSSTGASGLDFDGVLGVVRVTLSLPRVVAAVTDLQSMAGVTSLVVDTTADPYLPAVPRAGFSVAMDGSLTATDYDSASPFAVRASLQAPSIVLSGGRTLQVSYFASPEYVAARRSFSIVAETIVYSVIVVSAMIASAFLMRWMDTKSRLLQEKEHHEARSAVLMAQAARAAHEKTLRYGLGTQCTRITHSAYHAIYDTPTHTPHTTHHTPHTTHHCRQRLGLTRF